MTDGQTDKQTVGIAIASTALAMRALRRTVKIGCNDRMYAPAAIKKKDVATKCFCTVVMFTHVLMVSVGDLAKPVRFYNCKNRHQCGIISYCYNSGCLP